METKITVFEGVSNVDVVPKNSAVLVNPKPTKDGGYKFVAFTGVKSNKLADIIVPILSVFVAEKLVNQDFKQEFEKVEINGYTANTGVTCKDAYSQYLNSSVIYKTNSESKVTKALDFQDVLLRNTNLKIKAKDKILLEDEAILPKLILQRAKAIVAENSIIKDKLDLANEIFANCYIVNEEDKKEVKEEIKEVKEAK